MVGPPFQGVRCCHGTGCDGIHGVHGEIVGCFFGVRELGVGVDEGVHHAHFCEGLLCVEVVFARYDV